MSKILFLTFQTIISADGVSKKVFGQVEAMRNIGHDVYFIYPKHNHNLLSLYLNNNLFIEDMYSSTCYRSIVDFIKCNKIEILIIRYNVMASPHFLLFLKRASKYVRKILIEIPSYPYDGELKCSSVHTIILKYKEMLCRQILHLWVDYVITYANDRRIFHIPCIHISNAPAFRLPIKKNDVLHSPIKFIAVANIAYWHGYDRLINGFVNYYKINDRENIELMIVGDGNSNTIETLKKIVIDNNLQNRIQFLGSKDGQELDELFDNSDLAIGCLGCHRKRIVEIKSLKNVEYAMRGIPFIYSENNIDFDNMPYILKVPADESPIDVNELISFVRNCKFTPKQISDTVKDMTWENQFQKVFQVIL